jgi:His-Xaa-Ser system radical SAM maturase HxsC
MGNAMRLGAAGTPGRTWDATVLGRITRAPVPEDERPDSVLLLESQNGCVARDLKNYAGVICTPRLPTDLTRGLPVPVVSGVDVSHLHDGDVVGMTRTGYIRTLYRVGSPHNVVFATDRCNSYCLMCSQPPKKVDEHTIVAEHLRLLSLIPDVPPELGITGGEPTLLKDGLLEVVSACKARFPQTPLHVLSNGRLFYYGSFARRLAAIDHPDLMLGVPLYAAIDRDHDHTVQASGAFDQTVIGLQNLGRYGVPVEIRVVIHKLTSQRLVEIAEFIYRNLTFASHVALMGLEPMGFAAPNLEQLWVDPWDYADELERATLFLALRGMNVSVYNHQLCTVPRNIWPFCRQSISDWKQAYVDACDSCTARSTCSGFFTSSLSRRYSDHIRPITDG